MSRRYPLDALVMAAGLTEAALARAVGLSGSTLKHVREHGLAERSADRYAVRAGLHPCNVWPHFAEGALEEITRVCHAEDCGATFVLHLGQGGNNRRFCSDRCRSRESMRRYRSKERGRMANRRYAAAYRQYLARRRTEEIAA